MDITHPSHVHFFKHVIWELQRRAHNILITARDKDVTLKLLDAYSLEYVDLGRSGHGAAGLMRELVMRDYRLYKVAKCFKPDLLISESGLFVAQVGKMIGRPSLVFADTEHAKLANAITFPFADVICTPICYKSSLGEKHIKYRGYKELAYLHPHYFEPDESVLEELCLSKDERFIILRFVSWEASHDFGQYGFNDIFELVEELSKHGRVLITSEKALPHGLQEYAVEISPEKIHHLLDYATVYIGEGGTMASEAAVLGIPSIFVSSLTLGYLEELEHRYGLVYSFSSQDKALGKALSLLSSKDIKEKWQAKRRKMLNEKIDVTQFMLDVIEVMSTKGWNQGGIRSVLPE
ncbi:DUF354 domain-containing protein [Candidatus Poribacteria bacterium]